MDELYAVDVRALARLCRCARAYRRAIPRPTPGYFPLGLRARREFPEVVVLERGRREYRDIVLAALSRTHLTPCEKLSECVEAAHQLQTGRSAREVAGKDWEIPTAAVRRLIFKTISHGAKVREGRPFSCCRGSDSPPFSQISRKTWRRNVLDASGLAACYLTYRVPRCANVSEVLLACLHALPDAPLSRLRMLHCDDKTRERVSRELHALCALPDHPTLHDSVAVARNQARTLLRLR